MNEKRLLTSDDGIRGRDGRDDVLDNALSERPSDTLDFELLGTCGSDVV